MAFTYQFGANPTIDYPRLLIGDTVDENHIFEDSEIQAAYSIAQNVWQSSMLYSGTMGRYLPATPVSYLRTASILLEGLAANRSRLLAVTKLLDVTLAADGIQRTASALREQAQCYRDMDDNSGAFAIAEQVTTCFSFRDRYYKQIQRQNVT